MDIAQISWLLVSYVKKIIHTWRLFARWLITLERRKGHFILEHHEKTPSKVFILQCCFQQESSEPDYLFLGTIFWGQLEVEIVDVQTAPPQFVCFDLQTINGKDIFWVNAKFLKLWHDPLGGAIPHNRLSNRWIFFTLVRKKKHKLIWDMQG